MDWCSLLYKNILEWSGCDCWLIGEWCIRFGLGAGVIFASSSSWAYLNDGVGSATFFDSNCFGGGNDTSRFYNYLLFWEEGGFIDCCWGFGKKSTMVSWDLRSLFDLHIFFAYCAWAKVSK